MDPVKSAILCSVFFLLINDKNKKKFLFSLPLQKTAFFPPDFHDIGIFQIIKFLGRLTHQQQKLDFSFS